MEDSTYSNLKLQCSIEEKKECLKTVKKLSAYLILGRAEGFLALEPIGKMETDALLKTCLLAVANGLDQVALKKLCTNDLSTKNYVGKDFLNAVLISEGILSLQACQSPENLWDSLKGFFGTDFTEEYQKNFDLERNSWLRLKRISK